MNRILETSLSKVPQVTLVFWIIKIFATTLGETGGDTVSMTMNLGYLVGTGIFLTALVILVILQIHAKGLHPFLYWATIVASTTAGTTMADFADRSLGIGYAGGSILLFLCVMASLAIWYRSQGTVSVQTINTPKVEAFYWATITFSQTLGTALGDWIADSGLGYKGGALVFGALLALVAVAYFYTSISRVILFWAAFILTRPLGATVGDFLDKPLDKGGLDISRPLASAILAVIVIVGILLTSKRAARIKKWQSFCLPPIPLILCSLYLWGLQLTGNFHEVLPNELYRSAQLNGAEFDSKIRQYGIHTVLNLRGENIGDGWYDEELHETKALGIHHVDFRMSAKHELNFTEATQLIAIMKQSPKPLLIHCKAGADRTGLASALYLAGIAHKGEWQSEMQLWPIYGHLPLQFNGAMAMNRTFESLEPYLGFHGS